MLFRSQLPLDYNAFVALAKYQLRESKDTGGLDLASTVNMLEPAFYAASLRHLNVLVTALPQGTPLFCHNESSFLFSDAFVSAHNRLSRWALEVSADPPPPPRPPVSTSSSSQPPLSNPPPVPAPFLIPKLDLVASLTPLMLQVTLKKTLPQAMNQRRITKWFQSKHQDVAQVSYIRRINPSLLARANHLAKLEVSGPHGRFDLPSSLVIKYTPNSFLHTSLPFGTDGMSSYQLSLFLHLLLGLPMQDNDTCKCGAPSNIFGYHQLNCGKHACAAFHKGHDLCVKALSYEVTRLGMGAVDTDSIMKAHYPHRTSQKRGDIAVTSHQNIQIVPSFDHLPRSEFIIDVKVCSMVSANGDWKSRWNPDRTKFLNPSLAQKEQSKDTKHASNYAKIGYGFLPFVLGSFGGIGNSAARFLQALAFCETQQNDDLRAKTGLPPLDPSDRSQFRAQCLRYSSARISAALAKATVLRLTGAPNLPAPSYASAADLAHNCPGPSAFLPRRRPSARPASTRAPPACPPPPRAPSVDPADRLYFTP